MAGAAFIFGVLYHLATDQRSVQAFSTQFLSNDSLLKYGSNLFHVGIIMVFFGHIFGLLAPEWSYDWLITNEQKRQLAILMGSAAGLITLAGVLMMALRRATNPAVKANSRIGDWFFLALIILQVVTGLLGTTETIRHDLEHYMNLDRWAQGLVILKGNAWTFLTDAGGAQDPYLPWLLHARRFSFHEVHAHGRHPHQVYPRLQTFQTSEIEYFFHFYITT